MHKGGSILPARILIVEDEAITAMDLERILKNMDYEVVSIASRGEEAIQKAEEFKPDLVLMDIVLKGKMDGIEATQRIQSLFDIPIVYLTAFSDKETLKRAKLTKPYGFLTKPVNSDGLMGTIETALYNHNLNKKLARSEEKYRSIIDNLQDGFYRLDNEGKIIMASPSLAKMYGYNSPEDIMGVSAATLYKNLADRKSLMVELESRGLLNDYEVDGLKKDGSSFRVSLNAQYRYKDGEIKGIEGFVRDITEHKKAEKQLKESEAQYEALFKNSYEAILVSAPDGSIFSANPAAEKMFMMSEDEIISVGRKGIVVSDEKLDVILKERELKNKVRGELTFKRKNGSIFTGETTSCIFKNVDGSRRTSIIIRDITERKKAEEEKQKLLENVQEFAEELEVTNEELLATSDELLKINQDLTAQEEKTELERKRLETILETNPAAIIIVEANGKLSYINSRAKQLYGVNISGLDLADAISKVKAKRSDGTEYPHGESPTGRALKGEIIHNEEVIMVQPDGNNIPILASSAPLYNSESKIIGAVSAFEDITERKKAEDEMQSLFNIIQKERDKLSALVNSIPDEIWFADNDQKFTLANPSALKEFGTGSEGADIVNMASSLEVYSPDGSLRPVKDAPPLRALNGEKIKNQEEIVRTPLKNELMYRQVSAAPVKDVDGNIIGSVSVVRDITELKKAEEEKQKLIEELQQLNEELEVTNEELTSTTEELKENEEKFTKAFHSNPAAMTITRISDGTIVDANESFERLFGYNREETVGHSTNELKIWLSTEERDAEVEKLMKNGKLPMHEVTFGTKSGAHINVIFSVELISIGSQNFILSTVMDITERKKAEIKIQELLENTQQFAEELEVSNEELQSTTDELLQTNRVLNESEQRLRRFYESELMGVIYWNMDGQITDANDKFLEMIGYTREDLESGRIDWVNMTPPEYAHLDQASMDELKSKGVNKKPFEKEYICKDGSRIPILVAGAMLDDECFDGVAFALDITERKLAEDALQESNERFKIMSDGSPGLIWVNDAEGKHVFVNKTYLNYFQVTEEEVSGTNWQPLIHPDDKPKYLKKVLDSINEQKPFLEEARVQRGDGNWRWIETSAMPRFSSNNEYLGHIGISIDINERKKAEEELKESKDTFKNFFSRIPDYAYIISPDGKIIDVNEATVRRLGYKKEELLDKPLAIIYAQESQLKMKKLFSRWNERGVLKNEEMIIITKNGEKRTVLLNAGAVKDGDGNIINSVSLQTDITELKKAEEQLKESENKFKALYSSIVEGVAIHDIVNDSTGLPLDYVITDVNPAYETILDLKKEDVIGKMATEIYLTKNPPYIDIYSKVAETGEVDHFETYFEPMNKHFRITVTSPSKGKFATFFEDITERRKTEEEKQKLLDNLQEFAEELEVTNEELQATTEELLKANQDLKVNEEKVELERKRLETILETNPAAIIIVEINGKLSYINGRAKQLYGVDITNLELSEAVAMVKAKRVDGTEYIPSETPTGSALKGQEVHNQEVIMEQPDGTIVPILASSAPIFNSEGEIVAAVSVFEDITELKKVEKEKQEILENLQQFAEELEVTNEELQATTDELLQANRDLRENEQRLRRFYESGLIGVIYWNMDGQINDANDKFLEITGYTPEDLEMGRIDWVNMTPSEYGHLDEASMDELKATGVNKNPFEKEYIRKDGSRVPIIVAGAMLDDNCFDGVAFVLDITERKRVEEKYRNALDNMMEGCQIISHDWRYIYVNDAVTRHGKIKKEELLGNTMMDVYPGIDDTEMFSMLKNSMEKRQSNQMENYFNYPDGTSGWFELRVFPVPEGIFILSIDITERKKAEKEKKEILEELQQFAEELEVTNEELQSTTQELQVTNEELRETGEELININRSLEERDEQLQLFINNAPASIAMFDNEMNYISASLRWIEDYGLNGQELRGKSHYEIFPEITDEWKAVHMRCLKGAVEQAEEDKFVRADGSVQWIKWEARPWYLSSGDIGGIIIFSEDITKYKEFKDALMESERKFREVFNNANDMISLNVMNEEKLPDKFIEINDIGVQRLGYSKEELLNMSPRDIVAPENRNEMKENALELYNEGHNTFEIKHLTKDGKRISVEVNNHLVKYNGQKICLAISRDITGRKESEAEIKESLREKEVLLREIHHRVKNNLQIISSLLNLQQNTVVEEESIDVLIESRNRIQTMAMIHEELYRSSSLKDIKFKEFIKSMISNLIYSYGVNSGNIVVETDIEDLYIGLDTAIPCGLIINELLTNSLKYAFPENDIHTNSTFNNLESKGIIKIALKKIKDKYNLTLSDNGIGMPENVDIENTESLGLKIVNILVMQLDGSIKLERKDGTEFKIIFEELKYKERF